MYDASGIADLLKDDPEDASQMDLGPHGARRAGFILDRLEVLVSLASLGRC